MMTLLRSLLIAALTIFPVAAWAGAGTITTLDSVGATKTFVVVTNGSGNFLASSVLCDATAGANCVGVDSTGAALTYSKNLTSTTNALALNGANTVAVAIPNRTGTVGITITSLSATGASLTLEASEDGGASWVTANCVTAASGAIASVFSADNSCRMNAAGRSNWRLRVSTTGTGTANIAYTLSPAAGGVFLSVPIPAGTNAIGTVTAVGAAATGGTLAGNPVRIGISDGTNAQNVLAAIALADGVNGNNTVAVGPWVWNGVTWDRMPGTAANGIKAIVTNAGTFAVQASQSTASNLNATVVGTGTFATQVNGFTSWGGGTLGAMANYGTSPGAVLVPGVNAFVTNTNANGQATMANSSPVTIASNQSAVPVTGSGSAGTAASGVVTVQGIASMTPVLANPGTVATWGLAAPAAAPPTNAMYKGVLSGGATGGLIRGEVQCDSHKFLHITSATDTLVVQGVASQTIYICSWRARAAGVATWFLENTNDTNANCAGSKTQITGVATEAANTGETWGGAIWSGLKNTSGNGLCINSTGTGGVDIDLWYAQF